MWEPVSVRLREGHKVVRYDMRGYGMSRFRAGPFSPAADAIAVLDALELPAAHVAGSSYGGEVALDVALSAPDRVASLTLFAAPHADMDWSQDIEAFGAAEDAALAAGRLDEAVELNLAMWVDRAHRSDRNRGIRDLVAHMQRRAFELQSATPIEPLEDSPVSDRGLQSITCLTRVVIGGLDHPDFVLGAEGLGHAIPRAVLQRVPDAGHLVPLENDAVAAAAIVNTIREATHQPPGPDHLHARSG